MAQHVIQAFFLPGGAARRPAVPGQIAQSAHAGSAAVGRPAPVVQPAGSRTSQPGPPTPAFAPATRAAAAVQVFGAATSFAVDPRQIGLVRNGGKPLPGALLAKMEKAFGADFSAVRVHEGPQPARIGALAFTTGTDIYFAQGRYQPDTVRGQQLLGHELAHVIQQRQGRVRPMGDAALAVVQDRALEAEADRLGLRAVSILRVAARPAPMPPGPRAIQRMQSPKVPNKWGKSERSPLLIDRELGERREWRDDYIQSLRSISSFRTTRSGMRKVFNNAAILRRYELDWQEQRALKYYGSPFKDDKDYFAYMGPKLSWGQYGNGWNALVSAINKLPSFGELGLDLPLFRVERESSPLFGILQGFARNRQQVYIFHGIRVMNFGQYHLQSTSLIESTHSGNRENYERGLFQYRSSSARYMNNFSIQGMLDGGEALIPSGVITIFTGIKKIQWLGKEVDCAFLEEVGTISTLRDKHKLKKGIRAIDDHLCKDITKWAQHENLYEGFSNLFNVDNPLPD